MNIVKVAMALILALVVILIAFALIPSLFASATPILQNGTYKSQYPSTLALLSIVPLLFVVLILVAIFYFFEVRE
jgi:ABC-type transport system involved in multi-copper enzyme maturation permease subunit